MYIFTKSSVSVIQKLPHPELKCQEIPYHIIIKAPLLQPEVIGALNDLTVLWEFHPHGADFRTRPQIITFPSGTEKGLYPLYSVQVVALETNGNLTSFCAFEIFSFTFLGHISKGAFVRHRFTPISSCACFLIIIAWTHLSFHVENKVPLQSPLS